MILVLNTGSSSIKFQLFADNADLTLLIKGAIVNLGTNPLLRTETLASANTPQATDQTPLPIDCTHQEALNLLLQWINTHATQGIIHTVAHRVVHGGTQFTQSCVVTEAILTELNKLCPLAPLHQANNLAGIRFVQQSLPNAKQIACFDTAFHAHHEPLFTEYALPKTLRTQGVRRFGFHGLSYEWIVHQLQVTLHPLAHKRLVIAHLGNGASLCATHHGKSIDTTMGLTALDGLPMGTRCGGLDPGAVLYVIRDLGYSLEATEALLYNESGLKGLSNWTNDVSLLQGSALPDAQFALDYFCLKTAQYIAMMAVSLGGLDGLIFTGGIGENAQPIRENLLHRLHFLAPFTPFVIATNEERMMAIHAQKTV